MRDLQERLAGYEAAALAAGAEEVNGVRQVVQALDGRDQNTLKSMALAICGTPGFQVALFTTAPPYMAVLARSKDGTSDCAAALKALLATFGGRGGGKPELAHGGGLNGDLAQILAAARADTRTRPRATVCSSLALPHEGGQADDGLVGGGVDRGLGRGEVVRDDREDERFAVR